MTPQERAEQINRQEREAERADLIQRALANAARKRAIERAKALGVVLSEDRDITPVKKVRRAKRHELDGEMLTLAQIASRHGIDLFLLRQRVYRGVPLADALAGPTDSRSSRIYRIGTEEKRLLEWCKHYGTDYQTVTRRMRHGIPLQIALTMPKGARISDYRHHAHAITANDNAPVEAPTLDRPTEGPTEGQTDAPTDPKGPGVPSDLCPFMGTGAGSTARETPNITFPEKAEA